jgi:hypothetical protein
LTATHHPAHASHTSHSVSLGCLCSLLRRALQESEQVGALLAVFDASECHLIAGYEMLRIGDPFIERLVVPNDVRRLQRRRVPVEICHTACLPIPQVREAWTCHVLVRLQGMTSRARAEYALASVRVTVRTGADHIKRDRYESSDSKHIYALHDRISDEN